MAEIGIASGDGDHHAAVAELVEMLSNLNPSAKEFVPSSYSKSAAAAAGGGGGSPDALAFDFQSGSKMGKDSSSSDGSSKNMYRRRRSGFNQGRRRMNERLSKAEKEERIRKTIYVSDIDHNVSEGMLADMFLGSIGPVIDCRICGDPNSILRFAFVEFAHEYDARAALSLNGTICGYYPLKILPSKTAIMPVNESFLPKSVAEKEMCSRTVYCTNIDKKVTQKEVKDFFESVSGEIRRLRLLGDNVHATRIAFIEFTEADGANAALNCSGLVLGSLPVRVSPSKTPVRPRMQGSLSE